MAAPWDPWTELTRRRHLLYARTDLPPILGGAVYWPRGRYASIFIDRREGRVRRRCLLAHELVHDERNGGIDADYMPATWRPIVRREERLVDDIVADRLVPPDALDRVCRQAESIERPLTAADIAAEFDVTVDVAARALERRRRWPRPTAASS